MPFDRPTLPELIDRDQGDIASRLPGSDPRLRRNLLNIIAQMHAAGLHAQYGYLDYLAQQILPDTADTDWLVRHAAARGIDRLAAIAATGSVDFTGVNGTDIPAGTAIQTSAGAIYTTDALVTIAAGTATATVTAAEAGADGNQAAGVSVTLVTPIAGIDATATVAAGGLTGGADEEDDESLRARLLQFIRNPTSGGTAQDYIGWALAAHPDVTNVWVDPGAMGPGTITVRVMTYDATVDGIPDAAVLTAVYDYIITRMPVPNEGLYVLAPTAVALDVTFSALDPNTAAVQTAITASVADFLRINAEPGGTIYLSQLDEAISLATGEISHTLSAPVADIAQGAGDIAVIGDITFP